MVVDSGADAKALEFELLQEGDERAMDAEVQTLNDEAKNLRTMETETVAMQNITLEGMVMGDSICALVDVFQEGAWSEGRGKRILYGDNTATIAIIGNSGGPWRTRRFRLRSFMRRSGPYDMFLGSASLPTVYLTKVVATRSGWQTFWSLQE